jgi:hypothetical protein
MDSIKEAFQKVKQDISFLKEEASFLRENLTETREKMIELCGILTKINQKIEDLASTQEPQKETVSTHTSTNTTGFKPLKAQNIPFSTGNRGASTDRQTDRQTDKYTQKTPEKTFENASELLDSLDSIKKEIRLKFKRLTDQEILVFSKLYQLDEEKGFADYKTLSETLSLTESSIRDYVGRIIKKGVPVDKKRVNNKNIQLSIDPNLKKIASLHTILHLRSL